MIKEIFRKITKIPFFRSNVPVVSTINSRLSEDEFYLLLVKVLNKITYKPNFRFGFDCPNRSLKIDCDVAVDATGIRTLKSHETLTINILVNFNTHGNTTNVTTESDMIEYLFGIIILAEIHEMKEFYKVEGNRPFDPHQDPKHTFHNDITNYTYRNHKNTLLSRISVL